MKKFEICDLHGHFLPGMDDGSRSVAESLQMLELAASQGIGQVFATPHYYPMETVGEFLARRDQAVAVLSEAMARSQKPLPQVIPGAEVAYRPGLGNADDLEKLCLGNSRFLLLELPFRPWNQSMFRDISSIANVRGILPIIAHVERYIAIQNTKVFRQLMEQDVLFQINAESLLSWRTRGQAKRLLKYGSAHLLGSDCHNMSNRKPNLGEAMSYLQKSSIVGALYQAAELSMEIFREAQ